MAEKNKRQWLAIVKPGFTLFLITMVAAFALGIVYAATLEPIARQKAKLETETVQRLLPATEETDAQIVHQPDGLIVKSSVCYAQGEIVGYAVTAAPKGYAGAIYIMIGFDIQGVVQGIEILQHAETPGLGAYAALPSFTDQFRGISAPVTVTKMKGTSKAHEIEAITSATITSKAVADGVNAAMEYFNSTLRN